MRARTTGTTIRIDRGGPVRQSFAMRMTVVLLVLAVLGAPAFGADWGHYRNERFGLEAEVPPGFLPGDPPANGDGLSFRSGGASLTIAGSLLIEGAFEAAVRQQIGFDAQEHWAVTDQRVTPSWASWSGVLNGHILYVRAIPICGGAGIGTLRLTYAETDLAAFDPVIDRLVRSLRDSGEGWQC